MKLPQQVVSLVLVAGILLPLAMLSGAAQAQTSVLPARTVAAAAPSIEGFVVDEVPRLLPGTELNFEILGSPGGAATLHINGAQRNLILAEVEVGRYQGTYTISSRDKIAAHGPVTANLRVGNQVTSLVLNESMQAGLGYHGAPMSAASPPSIAHFNVDPPAELKGGDEIYFWMIGTPGAQVDLAIQGVRGKVLMPEVKSGEYATTYTIRNRDRILPGSLVTASMHLGEQVSTATLGKALQSPYAPAPLQVSRACHSCGRVEAINLVEVKGQGAYLGAIGGTYAGQTPAGQSKNSSHYEVVVRLQTGTLQAVTFASTPALKVGDKINLANGTIVPSPN